MKKIEQEQKKIEIQKEIYLEKFKSEEREDLKEAYLIEINKLNKSIEELKESELSIQEKRKLTAAGYVYIISNIGSFGENIYKIGMTRRAEPLDRVKELGDASVPFLFDVHALIYSTNAYTLESQLHKAFDNKRVNLINRRKEFFDVSLQEIRKEVLENHNGTVEFIETPEAIEYRESLQIKGIYK